MLDMLSASSETLQRKANKLASMLTKAGVDVSIVPVESRVGGGSLPNHSLPSFAVALTGDVNSLEEKLRLGLHAIIGRIHNDAYLLDVRPRREADFPVIVTSILEALA